MIKRSIGIVMLVILIGACTQKPDNVMTKDTFTSFLVDLHLADAMTKAHHLPPAYKEADTAVYAHLFKKYNVCKSQFDSTISYYVKNNPGQLETIYGEVINRLNQAETKIEKQIAENQEKDE